MTDSLEKKFPKLAEKLSSNDRYLSLRDTPVSLEQMGLIHKYFQNNFTCLDFAKCEIGDEHCKIISELLKENRPIKELILDHNPITADGIKYLALGLKQNKHVEKLVLCGVSQITHVENDCGIPKVNSSMEELGMLLSSQDCMVETLNFGHNAMGADSNNLGKALALNRHLTKLHLPDNKLKDSDCEEICEGLKNNSTLMYLSLFFNEIGQKGGISIAKLLSSPSCALEKLDISSNPIRGGMNAIFESLVENKKLIGLEMYTTGVSPDCLKQLGELFQKNKTLSEYHFMDSLGESILFLIADALKKNTIKKLHLKNCKMTHTSTTRILEALASNTSLKQLVIYDKFDTPYQGIGFLADALKKNGTLRILGFSFDFGWATDQKKILLEALKINYSTHVSFHNFFSSSCPQSLVRSIANYWNRNEIFRNSDKVIDETLVGHHVSSEFAPFSDIIVQFGC